MLTTFGCPELLTRGIPHMINSRSEESLGWACEKRMRLFCLQLEASCLQLELFCLQLTILAFLLTVGAFLLTVDNFSFFAYSWSFFAYSFSFFTYNWSLFAYGGKVYLIRALRDCKQRSLTVGKKAPTVSKKASPKQFSQSPPLTFVRRSAS